MTSIIDGAFSPSSTVEKAVIVWHVPSFTGSGVNSGSVIVRGKKINSERLG
jgi:hypothetical protein